ncbi:hypothetical protein HN011_007654 [Eciton burchellii]|nr:hypothetical protein HN011_007654 [Eciton burchellii]
MEIGQHDSHAMVFLLVFLYTGRRVEARTISVEGCDRQPAGNQDRMQSQRSICLTEFEADNKTREMPYRHTFHEEHT